MTDAELKKFGFFDKAHWIKTITENTAFMQGKPGANGLKGPEFPGCFNTGMRAMIRRSPVDGKYIIGRENDVIEVSDKRCFSAPGKREVGSGLKVRTWEIHGRKTLVIKDRKAAIEAFSAMCEADTRSHAKERAEVATAAKQLNSKDPTTAIAAALRLGDSGMI